MSALLVVTGCLVDSGGSSGDDGMSPGSDMNPRVCTMMMTVTGSFSASTTVLPPANYEGCWPIGTWTFSAQRGATDCTAQPSLLPSYSFRVDQMTDQDGNPYQVNTYLTDPSVHNHIKVSQGGNGLCEGELNLFSTDGTEVWIIKPEMYADKSLKGDGEYSKYKTDQWLGEPQN